MGSAEIRLGARAVEIDIDDDGPGIPEAELARVLEPFYRLEESRKRAKPLRATLHRPSAASGGIQQASGHPGNR